jgi:hypothetical protein
MWVDHFSMPPARLRTSSNPALGVRPAVEQHRPSVAREEHREVVVRGVSARSSLAHGSPS